MTALCLLWTYCIKMVPNFAICSYFLILILTHFLYPKNRYGKCEKMRNALNLKFESRMIFMEKIHVDPFFLNPIIITSC